MCTNGMCCTRVAVRVHNALGVPDYGQQKGVMEWFVQLYKNDIKLNVHLTNHPMLHEITVTLQGVCCLCCSKTACLLA